MNALLWNLFLATVWTLMTGTLTLENFGLGMVIGAVILVVTQSVPGLPHYSRRTWKGIALAGYTLFELVRANFRVARDVLRPHDRIYPGVIDLPLEAKTDVEISLLAVLITLTPGTTPIYITDDRSIMWVHSMNLPGGDLERGRRELKDGFERRVLEALR